jgi:serine/threonine protein kinase/WD40 repeat protein
MNDDASAPSARAQEIFFKALEKRDPIARAAYLEEACADDEPLRVWVLRELRKQTGHGTLLSRSDASTGATPALPQNSPEVEAMLAALKPEEAGESIGSYKLLEQLGEGGFGIVWKAEQERPVRREVALKVLKLGMNSRDIIKRFEQERQTLAALDHPGIATFFDAGMTMHGRPYFAMELVHGEPITDYCDHGRLTVHERLELFIKVCFAVQHAHQKAIIHRDLKPSNVLVTVLNDGSAAPKVIDLGLAKVLDPTPGEHTMVMTMAQALIGTPLYMSPEQAEGSQILDTRSDIYSLGVILYELLTGRTPHSPAQLAKSNDEIRRAIREHEPARPSSVLRTMEEGPLSAVAQHRDTQGPVLLREVRGELDAICLKAIEKEPARRYSSAAALAGDLQHFLLHEPISARAPSQWYRVRKFARRNRRTVLAAAVIFISIVAGALVSVREAWRARAAEEQASEQRDLAENRRETAERDRAAARLSEYVADVGLAHQSYESGNLGRASYLLEKHRPHDGGTDWRGWGWCYLWQLAQGDPHQPYPARDGATAAPAFSPAGEFLVIGGNQPIGIFRTTTRELIATLPVDAEWTGFTADGKTLLTFHKTRLTLWQTSDWSEAASWDEGGGPVTLSPDGKLLAIAVPDGVRVRETKNWQELRKIAGARGPICFSPDGQRLAAADPAGIAIWELAEAAAPPLQLADSGAVFPPMGNVAFGLPPVLRFGDGGSTVLAAENHASSRGSFVVRVWNAHTGEGQGSLPADPDHLEHTGAITAMAVSPDGTTLATTSLDHSARLWSVPTQRRVARLRGHRAEIGGVAFSPDGKTVVTCDRIGQVNEWPVAPEVSQPATARVGKFLGFSADGTEYAGVLDRTVSVYETATMARKRETKLQPRSAAGALNLAISRDFGQIAEAAPDGSIKVRAETKQAPSSRLGSRGADRAVFSPDGAWLVATAEGEPLKLGHLKTNVVTKLPLTSTRVAMAPDGGAFAAILSPAATPEERAMGAPVPASAAGRAGAAGSRSQLPERVAIFDLPSGKRHARLAFDSLALNAAFSPDSSMLATVGTDNAVRLWDARTGEEIAILTGHKQIVRAVAFAPDGRMLVSAADDGTVRFWNIEAQQELFSLLRLGKNPVSLEFSADQRTLAIVDAAADGTETVTFLRAPTIAEIDRQTQ